MSAGRVRRLHDEYEIDLRYTYFPLHPETPDEGLSLQALFAGREAGFDDMSRRLRLLMAQEGLAYGERTHTYNSRLAQELAVAGDAAGVTDALHDALFRAYFVEGLNVASHDVLFEVADEAGLDPSAARAAVEGRAHQATIDTHWQRARDMGITGVPTFVVNGVGVVGAQPYETLEELMAHVEVGRRTG